MRQESSVMVMFHSEAHHVVLVSDGKPTRAGAMLQYHVDEDGQDITSEVTDFRINKSMAGPDHVELKLRREGYEGWFCGFPAGMRLLT